MNKKGYMRKWHIDCFKVLDGLTETIKISFRTASSRAGFEPDTSQMQGRHITALPIHLETFISKKDFPSNLQIPYLKRSGFWVCYKVSATDVRVTRWTGKMVHRERWRGWTTAAVKEHATSDMWHITDPTNWEVRK